ncbi:MAG: 6,7-dimethyl-8-ribityllumazine synthase [Deltaproteobacteria bacterium]|nr:6,7-dimethyl-8-ribityllumazine synthase [Deltaproteobacteria bacterium]MBI3294458.1 6,7-dimethyl-8-ribityllumazine synthase [Deltaproteobacteria bacterium]
MKVIDSRDAKSTFTIGLVVSRFNLEISKMLLDGALGRLKEAGFSENQITVCWVPGAFEIPITAQRLAQQGVFEAVICLGSVIKGETDHYEHICTSVTQGCQQVAITNDIPIVFGVLTTHTEQQARERAGGKEGNKGRSAAETAIEMVVSLRQIG